MPINFLQKALNEIRYFYKPALYESRRLDDFFKIRQLERELSNCLYNDVIFLDELKETLDYWKDKWMFDDDFLIRLYNRVRILKLEKLSD